jgi:hypothetical protein
LGRVPFDAGDWRPYRSGKQAGDLSTTTRRAVCYNSNYRCRLVQSGIQASVNAATSLFN